MDPLTILDYVILISAAAGVAINVAAFVILARKQRQNANNANTAHSSASMFHDLLKLLMVYDVFVVICCLLQFALPSIWEGYYRDIRPHVVPWLLPIMHIAVMSSVYTTILISFERYIRICFICQLRTSSLLTEENVKYYKLFLLLFPLLFYAPKFFEVYTQPEVISSKTFNCETYLGLMRRLGKSREELDRFQERMKLSDDQVQSMLGLGRRCLVLNFGSHIQDGENAASISLLATAGAERPLLNLTLTEKTSELSIEATRLRKNKYYYRVYFVFLNTLFASLLPLGLLLFLNVRTARALFRMGERMQQQDILLLSASGTLGLRLATVASATASTARNGGGGCSISPTPTVIIEQRELEEDKEEDTLVDQSMQKLSTVGRLSMDSSSPQQSFGRRISSSFSERKRSLRASLKSGLFLKSATTTAAAAVAALTTHVDINNRKERRLAYISLYIVWLFIFCHVWKLIPTAYEVIMSRDEVGLVMLSWPDWLKVIEKVSHTLITLNSSINFLIYVVV